MRDLVGISEKWGRTGIEECSEGLDCLRII